MKQRLLCFLACFTVVIPVAVAESSAPIEPTFERDVRPILKAHCFYCHGEQPEPEAGLDLRMPSRMVVGGDTGPALVPSQPEASLLWQRVANDAMPEGSKKLTPDEKAILKRWIETGAKMERPEPTDPADLTITESEKQFWAFQPVQKPAIPNGKHSEEPVHPIDAFVGQQLSEVGLAPAEAADRRTLARRAYFDLLGLPPTFAEVEEFVNDPAPDAWEHLLDQLLDSPHYGERWGRHWLDVVGFAESDGVTSVDWPRPHAWRYRDYVIRAFNADKPFDQFLVEQLAGDELVQHPYNRLSPDEADALTATGFLRMAPDATETENTLEERANAAAETMKVVGTGILGMTVGCAQCHDHRYDPITQVDYHRLRAIFDPVFNLEQWRKPSQRLVDLWSDEERTHAAKMETCAVLYERLVAMVRWAYTQQAIIRILWKTAAPQERWSALIAFWTAAPFQTESQKMLVARFKLKEMLGEGLALYDSGAHEYFKKLSAQAELIRARKPAIFLVAAATEVPGVIPESKLFFRGDPAQPKQSVTPAELPILALVRANPDIPAQDPDRKTTGRRLAYARWLTSGQHPTVARVFVNRVWHYHFGRGLVATPGDFGAFGDRPSHPELLDWLAADFVEHGWQVKRLHKLIMTSHTYQQSSRRSLAGNQLDPENRQLHRMNLRRLEAEVIRDAILVHSGKLQRDLYGPSVPICEGLDGLPTLGSRPVQPNGMFWGPLSPVGDRAYRRSIYVEQRRRLPLPILEVFDMPVMRPSCDQRSCSTVPPQALTFLNSPFVLEQAEALATRVRQTAGADLTQQVRFVWRELYSAEPTEQELTAAHAYLNDQSANLKDKAAKAAKTTKAVATKPTQGADEVAFASFCQLLLGTNRFLYVD